MMAQGAIKMGSDCGAAVAESQEPSLLAALRQGDERAYAEFVRQYYGRMLAVARRFLRGEEDAARCRPGCFPLPGALGSLFPGTV